MCADSLDALIDRMMLLNPSIKSEAYSADAARQNLRSAAVLPDPEIEGGYQWGMKDAGNKMELSITQSMDWPGVYSALRKESAMQAKSIALSERLSIIEARENARLLLIDGIYIKKCEALVEHRVNTIDSLLNIAIKASRSNEMTLIDVEKLKLERLDILAQSIDLSSQKADCIAAIEAFTASPEEALSIYENLKAYSEDMILPLQTYIENIESGAPDIEQSRVLADASQARYKAEKRRSLPSLSAGYHYSKEEGNDFHGFVAGVSIPVFSTKGRREAARYEAMAADARIEQISAERKSALSALHSRTLQLYSQYNTYKTILDKSPTSYLLQRALSGGEISLMQYLIESSYHSAALLKMYEVEYRYQQSLALLNRYRDK